MRRYILCVLMFSVLSIAAFAQANTAQVNAFKKESPSLQAAVNDAVNSSVPGNGILQPAKAAYLEGYGIVLTIEVVLDPTTPFSGSRSASELKKVVTERKAAIQQKLEMLLKQKTAATEAVGATESVSVVLYLFNSNVVDLPNLPSQIVMTAKKVDPAQVTVRVY